MSVRFSRQPRFLGTKGAPDGRPPGRPCGIRVGAIPAAPGWTAVYFLAKWIGLTGAGAFRIRYSAGPRGVKSHI